MARDISMNKKARNVCGCGQGRTKKREVKIEHVIERTSATKRPFLTVQGMSKCLRSEVECVQSLIMAVARKETSIGNRVGFDCVYAFLSEVMYIGSRQPPWYILYRCIVGSRAHTYIFVVAIYKSSAFPLTSHYRTRDTCAQR